MSDEKVYIKSIKYGTIYRLRREDSDNYYADDLEETTIDMWGTYPVSYKFPKNLFVKVKGK